MADKTSRLPREIVLAGNYEQFRQYVAESGRNPREFIYPFSGERLLGLLRCPVTRVGTWYEHPNLADIERVISTMHD